MARGNRPGAARPRGHRGRCARCRRVKKKRDTCGGGGATSDGTLIVYGSSATSVAYESAREGLANKLRKRSQQFDLDRASLTAKHVVLLRSKHKRNVVSISSLFHFSAWDQFGATPRTYRASYFVVVADTKGDPVDDHSSLRTPARPGCHCRPGSQRRTYDNRCKRPVRHHRYVIQEPPDIGRSWSDIRRKDLKRRELRSYFTFCHSSISLNTVLTFDRIPPTARNPHNTTRLFLFRSVCTVSLKSASPVPITYVSTSGFRSKVSLMICLSR